MTWEKASRMPWAGCSTLTWEPARITEQASRWTTSPTTQPLTAENTGATADALTASNEELAYLRDIAEREAINRFTTAEVRIDMTGMTNRIEGNADLDGVISELTNGFTEALVTAAEGVHT
ncbi:MAG: hypothetical protein ACLU9S_20405 [Oscillospiraceae bacterium]